MAEARRTLAMMHPRAACRELVAVAAIWTPGPDPLKQWRIVLAYAAEHRYRIASFAQDAPAVVALAIAAGAEVIVAAVEPRADREALLAAPMRVEYARPPCVQYRLEVDPLIRDMARRGGDVETIARLLALPVAQVRAALATRTAERAREAPR